MRTSKIALILVSALAQIAQALAAPNDTMIVAGQRIGPITLGMSAADLVGAVGIPPQTSQQGKDALYSWGELVAQISDQSPGVDLILINDPRFETANHIRVGLQSRAALAVLGNPSNRATQPGLETWDYSGLTLVVRNNVVAQIRVRK